MLSTADFERGELAAIGTICEQGFKLTYYPAAAAALSELRRRFLARSVQDIYKWSIFDGSSRRV